MPAATSDAKTRMRIRAANGNETVSAWTSSFSDCSAWSWVAGATPVSRRVRPVGWSIRVRSSPISSTAASSVIARRTTTYADVPSVLMNRSSRVSAHPTTPSTRSSARSRSSDAAISAWKSSERASSPAAPSNRAMMAPPPAPNSSSSRWATAADSESGSVQPPALSAPGDLRRQRRRGDRQDDREDGDGSTVAVDEGSPTRKHDGASPRSSGGVGPANHRE